MTNRLLFVAGWVGTMAAAVAVGRFAAIDPRWDSVLVWGGAAGVVCAVIAAIASSRAQPRGAADVAVRRRGAIVAMALSAAILIALNVVAGKYTARWDFTADHAYRLAPETRTALRALDVPVRLLLFAEEADRPAYRDLLKEYSDASSRVIVEDIDVEAQPTLARQYEIDKYGTAILEYKDRLERINASSEQEFTNAITRMREGRTRKIYFTTGHAERDITSTERVGYSGVAAELQHENFTIGTLNFTEQSEVPDDATLVIVAGPRADFFSAEVQALRRYLDAGGAILFLIDPYQDLKRYITETGTAIFMIDPSSASVTGELRNLTAFLRDLGAELGNDVVVDGGGMGQFLDTDASVPVVTTYPSHPITQGLSALSAYPMARSVTPIAAAGKKIETIIETGEKSWSEADVQQLGNGHPTMDPGKGDKPGPLSLGIAASAPPSAPRFDKASPFRETRFVVVGDSDFVANYSGNIPGNSAMFQSIVRWLAQDKPVIIPPRVPQERVLSMTSGQHRIMSWLALFILPALAFGTGAYLRRPRSWLAAKQGEAAGGGPGV